MAPHRIFSFEFKLSPPSIQQNPPTRDIPISANFGKPQAIDISGFVGTITQFPSTIIAYDIGPNPPVFGIPPQPLIDIPNTFSMSDAPLLLGNTVVADVVGLSLYDVRANSIKRTKQVALMNAAVGLDVDPNFAMTNLAAALVKQQNSVAVTSLTAMPKFQNLAGEPVDLTMGQSDVWVASSPSMGTGTITQIGTPNASLRGEKSFSDGEPVAIGGGSSYANTVPGAIVLLVSKPTAGELRLFLGGNVNAAPVIVPLSGFPLPEPKSMKIVTIDNTQYAWVALLNGTTNTVALYNLATKAHLASFDVNLGAFEPLAVTAGVPTPNDPDPDVFTGSTTAFLHVLVKSN